MGILRTILSSLRALFASRTDLAAENMLVGIMIGQAQAERLRVTGQTPLHGRSDQLDSRVRLQEAVEDGRYECRERPRIKRTRDDQMIHGCQPQLTLADAALIDDRGSTAADVLQNPVRRRAIALEALENHGCGVWLQRTERGIAE